MPTAEKDKKDRNWCECEHIAHFGEGRKTPNGNPGHKYGAEFNPLAMKYLVTDYGTYHVCKDCAEDCLQSFIRKDR